MARARANLSSMIRSALVVLICLGLIAGAVAADETPSAAPPAGIRKCVDMNGREFYWSWSNVPFASTCSSEAVGEGHPKLDACRAGCGDRLGTCLPAAPDKALTDACFDALERCQTSCAENKN